jgi:hypothetical protein
MFGTNLSKNVQNGAKSPFKCVNFLTFACIVTLSTYSACFSFFGSVASNHNTW